MLDTHVILIDRELAVSVKDARRQIAGLYDLLEGGLRFTAGARATLHWDEVRSASLFIGRSMRADDQDEYLTPVPDDPTRLYDPSGLASRTSDWVVQGSFNPSDRMRGWFHATIDGNGEVRRAEATIDGRWGRRNLASVSYIVDSSNPLDGPENRNYEFVQLSGHQFIYGNWGVAVTGMPRCFARSVSTASTPMPLTAMISSAGSASMIARGSPALPLVATPRMRGPVSRRKSSLSPAGGRG